MKDGFTGSMTFHPSYDHREESHSKGCASSALTLIVRGPGGAITCDVMTGWMARPLTRGYMAVKHTPGPWPRREQPGLDAMSSYDRGPSAGGVHLHAAEQVKDWWMSGEKCPYLDGATCHGDSGYMVADSVLDALVSGGSDAAFDRLVELYEAWTAPDETE